MMDWGRWRVAALVSLCGISTGCYRGGPDGGGEDGAEDDIGDTDAGDEGSDDGEGGEDDGADDGGAAVNCDADAAPRATAVRMSRATYVNALTEVFGAQAVGDVQVAIDALPAVHAGVFASETSAATYAEVTAQVEIAASLAYRLTKDADALSELRPCLPSVPATADPLDDACLGEFIETTARALLRRPLTDDDRTRLAGDYAVGGDHSVAEGVGAVITALLIDPDFLYYTQTAGEETADGIVALTAHEVAAKLARVLWNSIPDAPLMQAADAGLDDAMLVEQVERMLADPRARTAIDAFYFDWLELERLPFPSEALFPDPVEAEAVREAMAAELLQFTTAITLDREGTYADLLLDRRARVDSEALASVYGVAASADEVELPSAERAGVLTRAGFLATVEIRGSNAGHLIKRGDRLSRMICRPLPLPDPENFPQEDPAEPGDNPDQGIRERFNEATAEAVCATCHVQLDGLGAPLGHYGSAGEWIDTETIELHDGTVSTVAIDTAAEVVLDGEPEPVSDALALSQQLAASRVGAHCLAQNLARNIVARPLDPGDACMVDVAAQALAPDDGATPASIRDALVQLVRSNHFRQVKIQ